MPRFGKSSLHALDSTTPRLQVVFHQVIRWFDCTVIEGHRDQEKQDRAFDQKRSKVKWPNGKHNSKPSTAADAGPYDPEARGVNWDTEILSTEARLLLEIHGMAIRMQALKNLCRFYYFAGFVVGVARMLGTKLRWGGDWDGDTDLSDQSFDDLVHFEEDES